LPPALQMFDQPSGRCHDDVGAVFHN
jgi:hypothetical protein